MFSEPELSRIVNHPCATW